MLLYYMVVSTGIAPLKKKTETLYRLEGEE